MSQTLVKVYLHLVFSTKDRLPTIKTSIEEELYSYLGGICKNLESQPIKIGGYFDHVHILCKMSKKITLMKLLEEIKSHSSLWMKRQGNEFRNFYWQGGYGAFSVSPYQVDNVINYISNQKEHHGKISFQDEYRKLLIDHGIEFDERYIWK